MSSTAKSVLALVAASAALFVAQPSLAVDAAAAEKLARQEGCLRCHGIDRPKDGPAYKQIAEKNRGKPDAEARLIKHLSSGTKVKFEDGHEEEHKIPKTKDADQIKNLIQWVLSL
ncbi:c-type cytochrome [Noviherbaspirillum denitrificans]|uniref:Class I cytochrome c n=1 Tax=Noviherbaspirillum denitrificans TaxID=1968433 RepID=A0A254T7Y7_9BURK|nr:c-type cytochrome [Noviherbaspirillum denitrificans]OWW18764.1 class I cytochrome c [Noviherbaspirillum denitrificans]